MSKTFTVDIEIAKKVVGNIDVTADTAEEAEDSAAELISLNARKNYNGDESTSTTGQTIEFQPEGE